MKYYLDTEFDGFGGKLLSLALVREDGPSVYFVFPTAVMAVTDPWVAENVVPILWDCPEGSESSPKEAATTVAQFLKSDINPVIITDWPADIRYFCELIEFPMGQMAPIASLKFELHRVDAYPSGLPGAVQHNAWWDAMALRHLLQPERIAA